MLISKFHHDFSINNLNWKSFQIDAYRCALGRAVAVIKTTVVHRALNDVIHDQAVGKVNFFMRAKSGSGIKLTVRPVINSKCLAAVIKPHHIFRVDSRRGANLNPLCQLSHSPNDSTGFIPEGSLRSICQFGSFRWRQKAGMISRYASKTLVLGFGM